jgi:hypothetical protein
VRAIDFVLNFNDFGLNLMDLVLLVGYCVVYQVRFFQYRRYAGVDSCVSCVNERVLLDVSAHARANKTVILCSPCVPQIIK